MTIGERIRAFARAAKRDVLAVWIAARDRRVPTLPRIVAFAVAAYALSPIDLIPDFVPIVGYLDDLVLLPLGLALVVRLIPAPLMIEFRQAATQIVDRPTGRTAAVVVASIWIALFVAGAVFGYRKFREWPAG